MLYTHALLNIHMSLLYDSYRRTLYYPTSVEKFSYLTLFLSPYWTKGRNENLSLNVE